MRLNLFDFPYVPPVQTQPEFTGQEEHEEHPLYTEEMLKRAITIGIES